MACGGLCLAVMSEASRLRRGAGAAVLEHHQRQHGDSDRGRRREQRRNVPQSKPAPLGSSWRWTLPFDATHWQLACRSVEYPAQALLKFVV